MVYRKNKSSDEFKDLWVDKLTKNNDQTGSRGTA